MKAKQTSEDIRMQLPLSVQSTAPVFDLTHDVATACKAVTDLLIPNLQTKNIRSTDRYNIDHRQLDILETLNKIKMDIKSIRAELGSIGSSLYYIFSCNDNSFAVKIGIRQDDIAFDFINADIDSIIVA